MHRVRVIDSHVGGAQHVPDRVLVFRHAEREDHIRPGWSVASERAHDPPLSLRGLQQSRELGEKLKEEVPLGSKVEVFSSPFVRTVATAQSAVDCWFSQRDAASKPGINVEPLLSEKAQNVAHRYKLTTSPDSPKPEVLHPHELSAVVPANVNLAYRPHYKIHYTLDGKELLPSGRAISMSKRVAQHIPSFVSRREHARKTLILATHGGVCREIIQVLTGDKLHYRPGYCHLHVLDWSSVLNKWEVTTSWLPAGSFVRPLPFVVLAARSQAAEGQEDEDENEDKNEDENENDNI
ncbi:hypothetical protein DIPPA_05167 [Diplonema papillatum]|nr:hypothetical protein DIPPA_05167 [Diplonema papillatum]|eukprot:gene2902-4556_t